MKMRSHNHSETQRFYASANVMRAGDDTVEGFFIKFLTQTMNTGDDGHPR